VNGRVFDQGIGEWREPTPVEVLRQFRDVIAKVDFSALPGIYDSIPWGTADAALESLEATTDKQIAALLKERFPWLDGIDELDVSGSDVIDQLNVWYQELIAVSSALPVPTLQE
jgi:hypothetical protein